MRSRHYDDWTVETWRLDPRLPANEGDALETSGNPPLWKDVTLALVIALLLWAAAAVVFL